jgi:hypothetical protein
VAQLVRIVDSILACIKRNLIISITGMILNFFYLRLWLNTEGNKATGNALEKALQKCDRQGMISNC